MPAGLSHQHGISGLQAVNGSRAVGKGCQIPLEPGHKDGKCSERNMRRCVGHGLEHNLRITDHKGWLLVQAGKCCAQFAFFHHHARGITVKNIAYGLHLRQNQPPLGRTQIKWNHQHGQFTSWQQIAQQTRLCKPMFWRKSRKSLAHLPNALACKGRNAHPAHAALFQH